MLARRRHRQWAVSPSISRWQGRHRYAGIHISCIGGRLQLLQHGRLVSFLVPECTHRIFDIGVDAASGPPSAQDPHPRRAGPPIFNGIWLPVCTATSGFPPQHFRSITAAHGPPAAAASITASASRPPVSFRCHCPGEPQGLFGLGHHPLPRWRAASAGDSPLPPARRRLRLFPLPLPSSLASLTAAPPGQRRRSPAASWPHCSPAAVVGSAQLFPPLSSAQRFCRMPSSASLTASALIRPAASGSGTAAAVTWPPASRPSQLSFRRLGLRSLTAACSCFRRITAASGRCSITAAAALAASAGLSKSRSAAACSCPPLSFGRAASIRFLQELPRGQSSQPPKRLLRLPGIAAIKRCEGLGRKLLPLSQRRIPAQRSDPADLALAC